MGTKDEIAFGKLLPCLNIAYWSKGQDCAISDNGLRVMMIVEKDVRCQLYGDEFSAKKL